MSNETKRDVLKRALDFFVATGLVRNINYNLESYQYLSEYDAAIPDNLPVIPKEIGEYIERQKQGSTLRSAIIAATDFHAVDDDEADWVFYHSETFALTWLLGVWRVEETGEIVKLEVNE